MRETRLRANSLSPTKPEDEAAAEGEDGKASAASSAPAEDKPTPPPVLRRESSSLANVEVAGQNTRPLGSLQPSGRKQYRPAASTRFGARSHFPSGADRRGSGLLPSGLPTSLVQRWHAGSMSGDLALREILDTVCRTRSGRDATPEERELASMTQAYTADGSLALGGILGGLVGGLPEPKLAAGHASSANLAPLHALLLREPEAVCCEAIRQFTRQLLTGAESEGSADRHALTIDLAKLSAEELNLAFRRACLKHHPHRESGSLGALLCVHLHFELVCLTWTALSSRSQLHPSSPTAKQATLQAAPKAAAPLDDAGMLEEIGCADAELAVAAEKLEPAELEALNERTAARAVYLSKVRDLLESQLEGMQAVGAYSVIGCSPDATDKELAAAYRDAARRMHPDRGGDKQMFQRLQAAYEEVTKADRKSVV